MQRCVGCDVVCSAVECADSSYFITSRGVLDMRYLVYLGFAG